MSVGQENMFTVIPECKRHTVWLLAHHKAPLNWLSLRMPNFIHMQNKVVYFLKFQLIIKKEVWSILTSLPEENHIFFQNVKKSEVWGGYFCLVWIVHSVIRIRNSVEVNVSTDFLHGEAVPLHHGVALRPSRHSNHFHSPEDFVSPLGSWSTFAGIWSVCALLLYSFLLQNFPN